MNMKRPAYNIILLGILLLFLMTPIIGKTIEVKSNLFFSENPIKFEPPMIKRNNIVFVPIRSLVSYFDGTMNQSKKDYIYEIKIQNNTLKLKQNVKEYTLNNTKKKFPLKPVKYKTRKKFV